MNMQMATLEEWRHAYPERWARIEGNLTRNELRTLKFLDAQVHLTREIESSVQAPATPEVMWLRRCIAVYIYVMARGLYPRDERSVAWVKNQRRGALCEYQVMALQKIPGWRWTPRRSSWNERAEDLEKFRNEFGRDPRVRSVWEVERALAHWYQRQRAAAVAGALTARQIACRTDGGS